MLGIERCVYTQFTLGIRPINASPVFVARIGGWGRKTQTRRQSAVVEYSMRNFLLVSCALAALPASGAQLGRIRSAPSVRTGGVAGVDLGRVHGGRGFFASSFACAPAPVPAPELIPAPAAPEALTVLESFSLPNDLPAGLSFSAEAASSGGAMRFDGMGPLKPGDAGATPPVPVGSAGEGSGGWRESSFQSPVDEAVLYFKRRAFQGREGRPPMVFVGGLGLSESFDALFAAVGPRSEQVFLWLRGNAPSAWAPARHPMDADARDLARMIAIAAEEAGSAKVELTLHSYSSLVFQRMLQMDEYPEVGRALELLRGSRVFMLNGTTHFKGSESAAGPEYEKMTRATSLFVGWLDMMDSAAALWRKVTIFNPLYSTARAWLAAWDLNRKQALELAVKDVVAQLRDHLKGPWAPEAEETRQKAVLRLERNAHDAGWQEALVRRVNDGARLEAKPADAARLRELGIRVEVVVSHDDQIIPWSVSKVFLEHLGVAAPEAAPPAGAVLESRDGAVRAVIVKGDHYVPLKSPRVVDRILGQ